MIVRAWRIDKRKWASTAFTGEGARLYGGRWNSKGRPLIYAAEHPALAAMEILVHVRAEQLLATAYVLIEATFDDSLIEEVVVADLPPNWADDPPPVATQQIGDAWLAKSESLPVLRVPSAVVRTGWNYLLNPHHARYPVIMMGATQAFAFDPRLLKK